MFYPLIRVLPSHPCFTLSSVFYPLIRVLPSHPCFTLSSVFYPFIRFLPFHPCFTLLSVFYPLIRPSVRPSVPPLFTLSSVPRFTLTLSSTLLIQLAIYRSQLTSIKINRNCQTTWQGDATAFANLSGPLRMDSNATGFKNTCT